MIKKIAVLVTGIALALATVEAQVETGSARGAQALDRARSAPVSPSEPQTVDVVVGSGKGFKEIIILEEEDKWWSINVETGWDSLYMFRGVNILGNGHGLYWLGGDVGVSPWSGGTITAGVWWGTGLGTTYDELNVFVDLTQSFGNFDVSFGWVYYFYPNDFGAGGPDISQNELYWALAYNAEIGSVTITPSVTYFLNVGPTLNDFNGWTKPGASFLLFQLDTEIPVTDWLSLAPFTAFGTNFEFNERNNGSYFRGGNNWELGLAMPVALTSWFAITPYVTYSYQWQDLVGTDENTWWAGVSASFSF